MFLLDLALVTRACCVTNMGILWMFLTNKKCVCFSSWSYFWKHILRILICAALPQNIGPLWNYNRKNFHPCDPEPASNLLYQDISTCSLMNVSDRDPITLFQFPYSFLRFISIPLINPHSIYYTTLFHFLRKKKTGKLRKCWCSLGACLAGRDSWCQTWYIGIQPFSIWYI